jgi:hypothetical protein
MLLRKHPKQRISNEAVQLTGELLRLFILEARNRAAIEVSASRTVSALQLHTSTNISCFF